MAEQTNHKPRHNIDRRQNAPRSTIASKTALAAPNPSPPVTTRPRAAQHGTSSRSSESVGFVKAVAHPPPRQRQGPLPLPPRAGRPGLSSAPAAASAARSAPASAQSRASGVGSVACVAATAQCSVQTLGSGRAIAGAVARRDRASRSAAGPSPPQRVEQRRSAKRSDRQPVATKAPVNTGLRAKPTPGLEPGTPSLRVKCSTS
jgi:hypothetical protein